MRESLNQNSSISIPTYNTIMPHQPNYTTFHTPDYLPNFFHWVCSAKDPSLTNLSFQPLEKQCNKPHNYGNTLPNLYYSTLQDTKFSFQSVSTLCLSQSTMLNLLSIQRQHPILCLKYARAFLNDPPYNYNLKFKTNEPTGGYATATTAITACVSLLVHQCVLPTLMCEPMPC